MKRHLCLFIFLLSLLFIQAQNKVLMTTEIRKANWLLGFDKTLSVWFASLISVVISTLF